MAFVDLAKDKLVLKVLLAGPPAVGKSERLAQLAAHGEAQRFGTSAFGPTQLAVFPLEVAREGRPVVLEVYEWHGPERADVRGRGLFVGLDGLIYLADAREDRWVDTVRQLEFLVKEVGKPKMARLPALLLLGRMDEGLLRLASFGGKLGGPTWSEKLELPIEESARFIEAVRLYAEVMLARVV